MPEQIHGYEIPDDVVIDCSVCEGSGYRLYDVDALGFAPQELERCNAPGCRGGEITIEAEEMETI